MGVNFDHPESLDTTLMRENLQELLAGRVAQKPIYDFNAHTRSDKTFPVEPRPVVIVEGILVLAEPGLYELMDIRIFVDAAPDVRLMRRIRRDMVERGRSIESILAQYERSVRPMHMQFVEPSKVLADIIIPRGGHNSVAIEMVLARISALLEAASKSGQSVP
jgi:uridine kinase